MGAYIEWTQEKSEILRDLYPLHKASEVAEMMGTSVTSVYKQANRLRLKKYGRGRERAEAALSPEQVKWLRENYADTANAEIMARLGLSLSMLHEEARLYGLRKSEEWVSGMLERARKARRRRKWPPKGYVVPNRRLFQKGVNNLMRLGPEREAERRRKISESRRALIASERRRILFGLDQRTGMKLTGRFIAKTRLRCLMRKRGYVIERGGNEACLTPQTRRSERCEKRCREMGIRLIMAQETEVISD